MLCLHSRVVYIHAPLIIGHVFTLNLGLLLYTYREAERVLEGVASSSYLCRGDACVQSALGSILARSPHVILACHHLRVGTYVRLYNNCCIVYYAITPLRGKTL